jgi:hypothetical protein
MSIDFDGQPVRVVAEEEARATGEGVLQSSEAGDEASEDDAEAVKRGAGECAG